MQLLNRHDIKYAMKQELGLKFELHYLRILLLVLLNVSGVIPR